MPEKKSYTFLAGSLKLPRLKPSDFYLLTEAKSYFDLDLRGILVLGLRGMYALLHTSEGRRTLFHLAQEIKREDLSVQDAHIEYKSFRDIPQGG